MNSKLLVIFALVSVALAAQCPIGVHKHCESCDRAGNCDACSKGYYMDAEGECVAERFLTQTDSQMSSIANCRVPAEDDCDECEKDYCYALDMCVKKEDYHFVKPCSAKASDTRGLMEPGDCQEGYNGRYCDYKEEKKSKSLSTGAVVGIVIAAIIFVIIIIVLIIAVVRHQKAKKAYNGDSTLFEDGVEFDSVSVL